MKLAMVMCLATSFGLGAGCKTDDSQPAPETPAATTTESKKPGRSGKIDLPPSLPNKNGTATDDEDRDRPSLDGDGSGRRGSMTDEEREQWRERRDVRRKERMAMLDTNGDGQVSEEERAAARTLRMDEMKTRLDGNGDGKLTVEELGKGRMMRRMDPATIDADKNGVISDEELAKSMDGMRGRFRGTEGWPLRRGQGEGSGSGSAAPSN